MSDKVTTTQNFFPTQDITHKPKRLQRDNLITEPAQAISTDSNTDIPRMLTLERAINYYETHTEGETKALYLQTAKWLRELLDRSKPVQNSEKSTEGE